MKKVLMLLIFATLFLAACGGTDTSEQSENETENTEDVSSDSDSESNSDESNEEVVEDEVYFKDNEAKLNDLKINITETKVIQVGEAGNEYGEKPVFAIWYDTTNLSDKDIDPTTAWTVVFTAIQDNDPNVVNELNVAALPDEQFLDSQLETIKQDGTVKNAVAYELDDLETPVTLVATQGIGGDELGEQTYNIK